MAVNSTKMYISDRSSFSFMTELPQMKQHFTLSLVQMTDFKFQHFCWCIP